MRAGAIARPRSRRVVDRLAAAFLIALMAIGSLALWLAVPVGGLWGIAKLTDSRDTHFVAAIFVVPAAMIVFSVLLVWLNRLYLRVARASHPEGDDPWTLRGPLEYLLRWSLFIAGVAFLLWFFFLAENPPSCSGR